MADVVKSSSRIQFLLPIMTKGRTSLINDVLRDITGQFWSCISHSEADVSDFPKNMILEMILSGRWQDGTLLHELCASHIFESSNRGAPSVYLSCASNTRRSERILSHSIFARTYLKSPLSPHRMPRWHDRMSFTNHPVSVTKMSETLMISELKAPPF